MRKLVVSEFVSIDGVMEDPGGAEGFDRGGWVFQFERGPEGHRFKLEELFAADALLLGRVTYEGFAEAWPSRSDEAGFAEKMNGMQKFVVSSTLKQLDWNNSSLIEGDLSEEISKLKQEPGEDILVAGSNQLAHALMAHDLVDEYRLMVFPIMLGAGKRLFSDLGESAVLALTEMKEVGSGVVTLIYERVAAP